MHIRSCSYVSRSSNQEGCHNKQQQQHRTCLSFYSRRSKLFGAWVCIFLFHLSSEGTQHDEYRTTMAFLPMSQLQWEKNLHIRNYDQLVIIMLKLKATTASKGKNNIHEELKSKTNHFFPIMIIIVIIFDPVALFLRLLFLMLSLPLTAVFYCLFHIYTRTLTHTYGKKLIEQ